MSVRTCVESLVSPRACCEEGCVAAPTMALLDDEWTEHIRCLPHTRGGIASKPLQWAEEWTP